MATVIAIVVFAAIALAIWFKGQLADALDKGVRVKVFLTVVSREAEDCFGVAVPVHRENFERDLALPTLPSPGCELDGLGTGPLVVARTVLEANSHVHAFIQLAPFVAAASALDEFSSGLVELGWQRLPMEPPYPASGPNNSFKADGFAAA